MQFHNEKCLFLTSKEENLMIELTEEQRQELSVPELIAIDPSTKKTYVPFS